MSVLTETGVPMIELTCAQCGKPFSRKLAQYTYAIKNGRREFYDSRACQRQHNSRHRGTII